MTKKEAIDEIRSWDFLNGKEVEAIQTLIPELRESDEIMRERAIAILKQQQNFWAYDGPMDKCPPTASRKDLAYAINVALSYLEKQKEQKPYGQRDECKDCQANYAGSCKGTCEMRRKEQEELPLMDGNADLYFDEWNQQKQNPTKRQCFEEGIRYAQRLQKEQKPAEWSDEEKEIIRLLIRVIRRHAFFAGISSAKIVSFLKSIYFQHNGH